MKRRCGALAAAAAIAALTSTPAFAAPAPIDPAALDHAVAEAAETLLAAPVREGRTSAAVITYVRDGAVRAEGGMPRTLLKS
jgi:hypothetical protein